MSRIFGRAVCNLRFSLSYDWLQRVGKQYTAAEGVPRIASLVLTKVHDLSPGPTSIPKMGPCGVLQLMTR